MPIRNCGCGVTSGFGSPAGGVRIRLSCSEKLVAKRLVGVQAVNSVASRTPMPNVDKKTLAGRGRRGSIGRRRGCTDGEDAESGEMLSIFIENSTPDGIKSKGNSMPHLHGNRTSGSASVGLVISWVNILTKALLAVLQA